MKVVSGGQTGVDRRPSTQPWRPGSLSVAGARGVGGRGRPYPDRYLLQETPASEYRVRTECRTCRDSDGTIILTEGPLTGGTLATVEFARDWHRRPLLVLDLGANPAPRIVLDWLAAHQIEVLNVAGPRESKCPGIEARVRRFLRRVFGGGKVGDSGY